jgi:hypothetical protein
MFGFFLLTRYSETLIFTQMTEIQLYKIKKRYTINTEVKAINYTIFELSKAHSETTKSLEQLQLLEDTPNTQRAIKECKLNLSIIFNLKNKYEQRLRSTRGELLKYNE